MDIYVLDKDRQPIAIIDTYVSLIWNKEYYTAGDFELYLPAKKSLLDILKLGYFLKRDDDETGMIIETVSIKTDSENGDFLTVKGKCLKSLVYRRIIRFQTNFNDSLSNAIKQCVYNNCICCEPPTRAQRKIEGLYFGDFCETPENIKMQSTFDNVGEWLENLCTANGYGWKIVFDEEYNFKFELYKGKETEVAFSDEFDNFISSEYLTSIENYKSFAIIAGEGEGVKRKKYGLDLTKAWGIDRFELFIDARDISSNDGEITEDDYGALLKARGKEKLAEHTATAAFSGTVEPNGSYKYKKDYNIGDIVTVENSYGITAKPRIVRVTESFDSDGHNVALTFTEWEV